jgi:hypothetical protein
VLRRQIKRAIGVVGACALAYLLLPVLVEHRLREGLVMRGFADADLDVASIGFSHVALRNIHLQAGADIGSVDIKSGISLLWKPPGDIAVRNAQMSTSALEEIVGKFKGAGGSTPAFDRVRVSNSTLTIGSTPVAVDGEAKASGSALEVTLTVRDPSQRGWSIAAKGRVVLGREVTLEHGHVDVQLPHADLGAATADKASLSADVSGNLSTFDLRADGVARGNVTTHGFAFTDATVPFAYARDGVHVGAGSAKTNGGVVSVEPFVLGEGPSDIELRAVGLRLDELVKSTKHITGTGFVDGHLTLRLDNTSWSLRSAALNARAGGNLQVASPAWRDKVAKAQSPFAVHAAIGNALTDFEFTELWAEVHPADAGPELQLRTRGRGRRNHQKLDIAVNVRGVRDVAPNLLGGTL